MARSDTEAASAACTRCGDTEPFHVHNMDERIEDYFTIGRGLNDFESALEWQRRYKRAAAERDRYKAALWAIRGSDPWPGLSPVEMGVPTSNGRYKSEVAREALNGSEE